MIRHDATTYPGPRLITPSAPSPLSPPTPGEIRSYLGVEGVASGLLPDRLPFTAGDTTAGSETELQAVVMGGRETVDLPLTMEQSNYFANILRRAASGELPNSAVTDLERFLGSNTEQVWDNSWVRFPLNRLGHRATELLDLDLRRQRSIPDAGYRNDRDRFIFRTNGDEWLRVPLSYLLRLTLAQVTGGIRNLHPLIRSVADRIVLTGMAMP